MFAARNAINRKLAKNRPGDETNDGDNVNEGDSADNQVVNDNRQPAPTDASPRKEGSSEGSQGDEDSESDIIKLLPLVGLSGWRRKYVQLSNIGINTLNNAWFNSLVMLCISWASLSVGLQTYPSLATNEALDNLDLFVLSVFILECIIKILAEGLTPWKFFTGKEMRWNTFDFAIIIMSLPVWGSALGGGNIAILRMLRLMRIMKLVKRVPQLYMIVMGLIGGLKSIGYIMLLLFLVFYLYAISGMYAWQNNDPFHFRSVPIAMVTLFRMSTLENWSNIMNLNYFGCDKFSGGYYSNNPDDAAKFQYCNVTAAYGANQTDSQMASQHLVNNFVATFYFITFILISAFVMLSLFIGAITMSMTQSMEQMKAAQEESERKKRMEKARKRAQEAADRAKAGEAAAAQKVVEDKPGERLSATQKKERLKLRQVLLQTWDDCDLTDMLSANQGDNLSWKGRYIMLASAATKLAEHSTFSLFITGVICMAGLLVGLQTSNEVEDAIGSGLSVIDSMILAVFTAEVAIKLVAEGLQPWMYFRSAWNTFDFIIVVGSFTRGQGGMLTMLRLLRLLRVLKLVRAFPQLQVIVSALMKGVSSIGYIGLILLLCFYVFGILGNMLFSDNDPFHFGQLHFAMITLFQCATMDGWSDVLYINYYGCDNYGYDDYRALGYECISKSQGFLAVLYFCSFIVIGAMVLITLFIGVVTTSMEEATQEMEEEKALLARIEALRVRKNVEQAAITSYMQVFHMLDLDGSGSVEEAELRVGLAAIGKYPSYEELKEMMDVVDEDGSGQIDIVEFVEFMIHVREKSNEQKLAREAALAANAAENGPTEDAVQPLDDDVTTAVSATDDVVQAPDSESRVVDIRENGNDTGDDAKLVRRSSMARKEVGPTFPVSDAAEPGVSFTSVGESDYAVRIDDTNHIPTTLPSSVMASSLAILPKNGKSLQPQSGSGSSRKSTPRSSRNSGAGGGVSSKILPSG